MRPVRFLAAACDFLERRNGRADQLDDRAVGIFGIACYVPRRNVPV